MSLSDQWRIRKSTIPEIELNYVLRALTRVIGSISPNTETVKFGIMTYNEPATKTIILDIREAIGKNQFPLDPETFDELVGLASHEAGHSGVLSGEISKKYRPDDIPEFTYSDLITIAEEVYDDGWIRRNFPVHGLYLDKARAASKTDSPVDTDSIGQVWLAKSVYGHTVDTTQISKLHEPVHSLLDGLTKDLSFNDLFHITRKTKYQNIYTVIAKLLQLESVKSKLQSNLDTLVDKGLLKQSPKPSKELADMGLEPQSDIKKLMNALGLEEDQDKPQSEDQSTTRSSEPLPIHPEHNPNSMDYDGVSDQEQEKINQLLQQVDQASDSATEDITQEVDGLVDDPGSLEHTYNMNMAIIYSNDKGPLYTDKVDAKLIKDLSWIQRIHNVSRRQVIRGQEEGLLDRRRLHKHQIDQHVYKRYKRVAEQELDLVLLLDRSSSMSRRTSIYEASRALRQVLPRNNVQILSYSNPGINVDIKNHTSSGQVTEILPDGGTPSGKALLGAAVKYPTSMIIHFTDGAANEDIMPNKAGKIIAEKFPKIKIVNVILSSGRYTDMNIPRTYVAPQLSKMWSSVVIGDVDEFPEVLKKVLKPWYQGR